MGAFKGNATIGGRYRKDLLEVVKEEAIPQDELAGSADIVAPALQVPASSGFFPVKNLDGDRELDGTRGQDGSYSSFRFKLSDDSYKTTDGGWEMALDSISDYELMQLMDAQMQHAIDLNKTYEIRKQKIVADAFNNVSAYGSNHSNQTATKWTTGTNMLTFVKGTIRDYFFKNFARSLRMVSVTMSENMIEELVRLADIRTNQVYTAGDPTLMPLEQQADIIRKYLGVREVIPVQGAHNVSGFYGAADYSRLWTESSVQFFIRSSGGGWDRSFARQLYYPDPIGGRIAFQDYVRPETQSLITRLLFQDGLKMDYTKGYLITNAK